MSPITSYPVVCRPSTRRGRLALRATAFGGVALLIGIGSIMALRILDPPGQTSSGRPVTTLTAPSPRSVDSTSHRVLDREPVTSNQRGVRSHGVADAGTAVGNGGPDSSPSAIGTLSVGEQHDTISYRQILHPDTGSLHREEWRNGAGELHRAEGPAVTGYRADGSVSYQWYYRNGLLHATHGAAMTGYRSDGTVFIQNYYANGRRHRNEGPAAIGLRRDGSVFYEAYYRDDALHRTDGPAQIWRLTDSSIPYEAHYIDGMLHRADGPAVVWYTDNGAVERVQYFTRGKQSRVPFVQEQSGDYDR